MMLGLAADMVFNYTMSSAVLNTPNETIIKHAIAMLYLDEITPL